MLTQPPKKFYRVNRIQILTEAAGPLRIVISESSQSWLSLAGVAKLEI